MNNKRKMKKKRPQFPHWKNGVKVSGAPQTQNCCVGQVEGQ
jgi:hypothetical protein